LRTRDHKIMAIREEEKKRIEKKKKKNPKTKTHV
jgi:hypothetical protein